jgi:Flp pilus assembly protein TadD
LAHISAHQPLSKEVHRNLIRLHMESGDHAAAYAAARLLLALDTRDPWANAALAHHLEQIGQSKAAGDARKIALQAEPDLQEFFE